MSYFSVTDFIESGEKSLKDKNYWSALSVALMLPSICSRVEYADHDKYPECWNEKRKQWKDRQCYEKWCQNTFSNSLWLLDALGPKYAEILYKIRCDIVHAGTAQIYENEHGIFLAIDDENGGGAIFPDYRIISIGSLCHEIFIQSKSWCESRGADKFKYTFVFDFQNNDDHLLYQRLFNEVRTDQLEKKFKEELEERKSLT